MIGIHNCYWTSTLSLSMCNPSPSPLAEVRPSCRCQVRIHAESEIQLVIAPLTPFLPLRSNSSLYSMVLPPLPVKLRYTQSFWKHVLAHGLYLWMAFILQVSFRKLLSIMRHSINWRMGGYGRMRQTAFSTCGPAKVSWGLTDCSQTKCWRIKNTNRPSKF